MKLINSDQPGEAGSQSEPEQLPPFSTSQMSQPNAGAEDGELTLEQFLDGVVQVTIAVLTRLPDKKGEWWEKLNLFHAQAQRHADRERAAFFDALRQLLEGASPARLSSQVPEAFQRYWQTVLDEMD
jgi:hypothetical protein